MFDFLEGVIGPPPPVGEVVEQDGRHMLLLQKLTRFRGTFLAVPTEGPDSRTPQGPVEVFVHAEVARKEKREAEERARRIAEHQFVREVRYWARTRRGGWPGGLPGCSTDHRGCMRNISDDLSRGLCEQHRDMFQAYLAKHPEAWPPR